VGLFIGTSGGIFQEQSRQRISRARAGARGRKTSRAASFADRKKPRKLPLAVQKR